MGYREGKRGFCAEKARLLARHAASTSVGRCARTGRTGRRLEMSVGVLGISLAPQAKRFGRGRRRMLGSAFL